MDSEEEREEYVLENLGYIWRGTSYYKSKLAWKFGQVRCLPKLCMKCMEVG